MKKKRTMKMEFHCGDEEVKFDNWFDKIYVHVLGLWALLLCRVGSSLIGEEAMKESLAEHGISYSRETSIHRKEK